MEQSESETPQSPFLLAFEGFRTELDEHHDRRERIVKVSRDITALSKKMVRSAGRPIPQAILKTTKPHYETINTLFRSVSADLQGGDAFRYARNITGGLQEFVEAIVFQHYLECQELLSHEGVKERVKKLCAEGDTYELGAEDYVLGVLDASGELMRFAITTMALVGQSDSKADRENVQRSVLDDLRKLYLFLTNLDCGSDFHFKKDFQGKLSVMNASVDKVEKALYGLVVRGSERPKGWIPPDQQERGPGGDLEVQS
ncbi:MAG: hypothetical protein M1828_000235 [Chrysothrix sp. TS-e1954]|nr:MAG: hypothetical protein M1828_000235 [Chrysothrix sp. TS-e1954]